MTSGVFSTCLMASSISSVRRQSVKLIRRPNKRQSTDIWESGFHVLASSNIFVFFLDPNLRRCTTLKIWNSVENFNALCAAVPNRLPLFKESIGKWGSKLSYAPRPSLDKSLWEVPAESFQCRLDDTWLWLRRDNCHKKIGNCSAVCKTLSTFGGQEVRFIYMLNPHQKKRLILIFLAALNWPRLAKKRKYFCSCLVLFVTIWGWREHHSFQSITSLTSG